MHGFWIGNGEDSDNESYLNANASSIIKQLAFEDGRVGKMTKNGEGRGGC